jgi:hypothetical protein
MKPTEFSEKIMELSGWPVRAISDEAEQEAIRRAQDYLAKTRRFTA